MKTKNNQQSGYSLVEVLIAISILLLATVGPMTIASRAQQSAQYSREQNSAFFLAQEGIEAIINIRNENGIDHIKNPGVVNSNDWLSSDPRITRCINANGCGLYFNGTVVTALGSSCPVSGCPLFYSTGSARARYTHDSSGNAATAYTRSVFVESLTEGVKVTSRVQWQPKISTAPKVVELETYLYDIYNSN